MKNRVVMYGASEGGKSVLRNMRENRPDIEILAISDSDPKKWGMKLDGYTVIPPAALLQIINESDCDILISTQYYESVIKYLRQLQEEAGLPDLPDERFYYQTDRSNYADEDYEYGYPLENIYEDEPLNRRYIEFLKKGFLHRPMLLPYNEIKGLGDCTYFDVLFGENIKDAHISFLDIGAYDGDSIPQVVSALGEGNIRQIVAFEPVKENFAKLVQFAEDSDYREKLTLKQMAIGEKSVLLRFASSGMAARETEDGSEIVPVETLDSFLDDINYYPFIKMDIAGKEIDALKGGKKFILEKRPVLALCAYHLPHDFWHIPTYLKSFAPDYRFYLRGGMHLVCYAIPEEFSGYVATAGSGE